MPENDIINPNVQIVEDQNDIVIEETIDVIEVAEDPLFTVDSLDAFPALGESNENLKHQLLNGRELSDQHPIMAITGLRDELDSIEALQTVYSNEKGSADYYLWEDENLDSENRVGLFVSLCEDVHKIKICANTDIFGVTVSAAAFVGGQANVRRDDKYGLVAHSGYVAVQCESDVAAGDCIISNNYGMAAKVQNGYGYPVTSLVMINGVQHAIINLHIQMNKIRALVDRVDDLNDRVDKSDINVVSAMTLATRAYNMASNTDRLVEDAMQQVGDAVTRVDQSTQDIYNVGQQVASANKSAAEAKAIAETVVVSVEASTKQANDTANNAYKEVEDLKTTLEPIMTWEDESGNKGADYFVEHITNGVATKTEIATLENLTKESQSAIQKNAEGIQSLVTSIDKYSVGEFSQAYGLTREQAASILKPGMVYIPTKHPKPNHDMATHDEVYLYTDANGQIQEFTQSFTPGYYYIWTNDGDNGWLWKESEHPLVAFFSDEPVPISGLEYWYVDSNEPPIGYEPYALYALLDGEWTKVNILEGNVTNRVVSRVQQSVDGVTAEVTNARGSAASLDLRLTDFETQVNLATFWNQPQSDKSNLAAMRLNSDDSGSDLSLLVMDKNGEEVVHGASIVLGADGEKSHINIDADYINFEGFATFVRPDDLGSNGATNIDGARIATGVIHSANYDYEATDEYGREQMFSKAGTSFDLTTGTIISSKFRVDEGDAYFEGLIKAREGEIAQFNIKEDAIYSNQEAYDGNDGIESEEGVYLGIDGIGLGAGKFYVDKWGNATLNGDIVLNGNITWGTGAQLPETLYFYYLSDVERVPATPVYDGEVVSADWYPYPLGVDEEWPYEYISQCKFKNGEYVCTTPVLWANYAKDGSDGSDAEITDEMMFNWFTNDGSKGGIFSGEDPESGKTKLFINADYIRTGALTFGDGNYFIQPGATKGNYLKLPGLTVASEGTSLSFGNNFYINNSGGASLSELYFGVNYINQDTMQTNNLYATTDIFMQAAKYSLKDVIDNILKRLHALDTFGTSWGVTGDPNAHEHKYDGWVFDDLNHYAMCTTCGHTQAGVAHQCDIDVWGGDDTQHYRICVICNQAYAHESHNFNENDICTVCGAAKPKCTHPNLQHRAYKAPTCTEDGNNEYWSCPDCGAFFLDANASTPVNYHNDVVIGFLGHDFPETYTDFGNGCHALVCNRCGEYAEGSYHEVSNPDAGCTICNK